MTAAKTALALERVEPCAACGDPGGKPTRPHLRRPGRLDGSRFGIDGPVCLDCWRNARRVLRYRIRKASVRPCDACGDPAGRVTGRAVNPSRYEGTPIGRPGTRVCHACRFPADDPDDLPDSDPVAADGARRLRDQLVRAAALAIRAEYALEVEAKARRREARLLPPTLAELVAAAKARERARRSWTFGPANPIGVQCAPHRPAETRRFLAPMERISRGRWSP